MTLAEGSQMVFVSGQVAWNAPGADFPSQVEDAYLDVHTTLTEAGATFEDVVKLTVYVADGEQDMVPALLEGSSRAYEKLGVVATPPATLIGVSALDVLEHRVEIEATAVFD